MIDPTQELFWQEAKMCEGTFRSMNAFQARFVASIKEHLQAGRRLSQKQIALLNRIRQELINPNVVR